MYFSTVFFPFNLITTPSMTFRSHLLQFTVWFLTVKMLFTYHFLFSRIQKKVRIWSLQVVERWVGFNFSWSGWGGGGTPLFGLYGYVLLNRVWFSRSWLLNRVYNNSLLSILNRVRSFWAGSLSKSVKTCDERSMLIFFTNNFFPKHQFPQF